ncbi:MAG: DUF4097 family beta strand repeat-containing protein [Bacteroidota bacterium]
MKAFYLFVVVLLQSSLLFAQRTIQQSTSIQPNQEVNFDCRRANVKFTTWNKNEIEITGTASVNMGEHDDAFEVEIKRKNGSLEIRTFLKEEEDIPKMIIMSKDGMKTYKRMDQGDKGWDNVVADGKGYDYVSIGIITEIELEIKVPQNIELNITAKYGNVDIKDFQGALYAKNTHGYINAIFSKTIRNNVQLMSTHDFVDVSMPSSSQVDLELKSSHGDIYTDMNLNFSKDQNWTDQKSCTNKNRIVAKLNSGGVQVNLKSTHYNDYLRENKLTN